LQSNYKKSQYEKLPRVNDLNLISISLNELYNLKAVESMLPLLKIKSASEQVADDEIETEHKHEQIKD
jgi:hypothetical protein